MTQPNQNPEPAQEATAYQNTDRELWRERPGDYYADSIHVTEGGGIGIDCGGTVHVKPLRAWHRLAEAEFPTVPAPAREQAEEWKLELLEDYFVIRTGLSPIWFVREEKLRTTLEDTVAAHNTALAAVRAELEEALERNAAQCGALDRISDALGVPLTDRTTLSAFTALRNMLGTLECTKAERDRLRAENERLQKLAGAPPESATRPQEARKG